MQRHCLKLLSWASTLIAVLVLVGCDQPASLPANPPPIGDFRLGHVTVSAKGSQVPSFAREVAPSVMEEALVDAMKERLGRHKGGKYYNLSIAVDAYALAEAGIPIVASLKSGMIIRVVVWEDATATRLTDPDHTVAIVEPVSPDTILGSGLTREAEEQATVLSRTAAAEVERWLRSPESPLPGVGQVAARVQNDDNR